MTLPDGYRLHTIDESQDTERVLQLDTWAFPTEVTKKDWLEIGLPIPWSRVWGVSAGAGDTPQARHDADSAGDPLAGLYATYTLSQFPVPGAEVACGWLSWVGVHPGHRRRGILRGMLKHHFADCRARGEAFSGLNASEAAIYGRFGYGSAGPQVSLTIARGAELRDVAGSGDLTVDFEEWDPTRHEEVVASLQQEYARVPEGIGRPGWASWETPELRRMQGQDPPALREGQESLRVAIVRNAGGEARGYARFRRKPKEERHVPAGTAYVREAVALDAAAAHRLWSVLVDLDQMANVEAGPMPLDDPIVSLLVDIRAAMPTMSDLVWIRIVDAQRALSERRYAADVDTVIEVTDEMLPENSGRWRVRAAAFGAAEVTRSEADADVTLGIRELGAVHLGTTSLAALAQAGLVTARSPEALARAAVAWSWPVAAGANWVF